MNLAKTVNKIGFANKPKRLSQKEMERFATNRTKARIKNMGMLSFIGVTTLACNASQDEQCYGSLGFIVGSLCASQNNTVVNTEVKLTQVMSGDDFILSRALDVDGNQKSDTFQFSKKNDVIGTKYTLTDGDILKSPGTVFLDLINSGSINGQKIFNSDEIEISTQGETVILTSNWHNNDVITIKNSDQSVTLNDLQASKLDSVIADDNVFYPNTEYRVEDVNALSQVVSLYFNEAAILGTSTEVDLLIKDSVVTVQAGVFIDPSAVAAAPAAVVAVDPFLVVADSNIEKLNLRIADTESSGSRLVDLVFNGLETLNLTGGVENYKFEITEPLDSSLMEINAINVPADLVLNVSDSTFRKIVTLGSGDDILMVGNSLIEAPASDSIGGGQGLDKILIAFAGATSVAPSLSSFEVMDVAFNGESTLDFSDISDMDTLNIIESSTGASLTNVPFDLSKLNIMGSQAGDWSIAFENNAASTLNLNWYNNTGSTVTVNKLALNEVESLSVTFHGSNDVNLVTLSVDSDDTSLVSATNIADGNLVISNASQLDTFDGVSAISLTTTEGGNISLGSAAASFGISDAPKLSTINLVASQTGTVELGSIGSNVSVESLQSISISSSGADVTLGSIVASNSGTFSTNISSSATVFVGSLDFANPATSFIATGSGNLGPLTFLNESYSLINVSDLITNVSINFSNANIGSTIITGSGNDTIVLGLGADIVTGNEGSDIFVISNGSTGLTLEEADLINDFQSGTDKLKLGVIGDGTLNTGNYVESSTSVANYSEALGAANSVLSTLNSSSAATELYAFEFDSSYGYLFIDSNSDGVAEDLLVLSGIESTSISANDIIA